MPSEGYVALVLQEPGRARASTYFSSGGDHAEAVKSDLDIGQEITEVRSRKTNTCAGKGSVSIECSGRRHTDSEREVSISPG